MTDKGRVFGAIAKAKDKGLIQNVNLLNGLVDLLSMELLELYNGQPTK